MSGIKQSPISSRASRGASGNWPRVPTALSPAAERALRHDAALEVSHRKWLATLAEDGRDREARARAIRQHAGARRYGRHVDSRIHRAGPNEARAVSQGGFGLSYSARLVTAPDLPNLPSPPNTFSPSSLTSREW